VKKVAHGWAGNNDKFEVDKETRGAARKMVTSGLRRFDPVRYAQDDVMDEDDASGFHAYRADNYQPNPFVRPMDARSRTRSTMRSRSMPDADPYVEQWLEDQSMRSRSSRSSARSAYEDAGVMDGMIARYQAEQAQRDFEDAAALDEAERNAREYLDAQARGDRLRAAHAQNERWQRRMRAERIRRNEEHRRDRAAQQRERDIVRPRQRLRLVPALGGPASPRRRAARRARSPGGPEDLQRMAMGQIPAMDL